MLRKALILAAALALAATACPKKSATPVSPAAKPPQTVSPQASESVSPSPAAGVVSGCAIQPKTDCPGAGLRQAILHEADLRGANLKDADLFGADLRRADLRGADLTNVNLRNADLTDAKLMRANLDGAILEDVNLTRANLNKAEVSNGQFVRALRCETTRSDGTTDNSGCPEDFGASPSPKPAAKQPEITKFDISPAEVTCASKKDEQSVNVRYKTTHAKSVEFAIDNDKPKTGFATKGTATLAFDCHEDRHTYTITATGSSGKKATQSATVHSTA